MNRSNWAQLLLAVGLLGAAAVMFLRSGNHPRIDFGPYSALGTVAAEETAALAGGKGSLVLVAPDPTGDPVLQEEMDAFRKALGRSGGCTVKAVETVTLDPAARMALGGALPPDRYEAIRRKHADAAGFVLFLPFPPLRPEEAQGLGLGPAKVVVLSSALPGYDALLEAGVIHLALVPRELTADAPTAPAKSARDVFDREYRILRGERAASGSK